jgi:hypothetical protein
MMMMTATTERGREKRRKGEQEIAEVVVNIGIGKRQQK